MKHKLRWAIYSLLLLPIAAILALIAINAFDEQLDPNAMAWGAPRPSTAPETGNGYHAFLAIGAPDGGDGIAYARARVAEARAAARENRNEKQAADSRAARPRVCEFTEASCLTAVRERRAELGAALQAYKEDLARYSTLIAATHYEEVFDYTLRGYFETPHSFEEGQSQSAWLTRAAMAIEAGHIEEALAALEGDFAFNRVMLAGTRTLHGKMIAIRRYRYDLVFVADLLHQKSAILEPHMPRLRAMLKPIEGAALKFDAPMETEFAIHKHEYMTLKANRAAAASVSLDYGNTALSDYICLLLYSRKETVNRAYGRFVRTVAVLNQPANRVVAADRDLRESETWSAWDSLRNPIGKMLVYSRVSVGYSEYAMSIHDLDGFNRLVTLRMEALAARVGVDQAAEFAAKSAVRLHDPYGEKPMAWNAAKKRFQFKPQAEYTGRSGLNIDAEGMYVMF